MWAKMLHLAHSNVFFPSVLDIFETHNGSFAFSCEVFHWSDKRQKDGRGVPAWWGHSVVTLLSVVLQRFYTSEDNRVIKIVQRLSNGQPLKARSVLTREEEQLSTFMVGRGDEWVLLNERGERCCSALIVATDREGGGAKVSKGGEKGVQDE